MPTQIIYENPNFVENNASCPINNNVVESLDPCERIVIW